MVRKLALIVSIALLGLAGLACGGRSSSTSAKPPTPRPSATAKASTGPTATIDPRNGPAGTPVTISGSGWPAGVQVTLTAAVLDPAQTSKPYATVTTGADGTFVASFRLEKTPTGDDLMVGRYDLVAQAGSTSVDIMFLVETKRPVGGSVGGGQHARPR